MPSFTPDPTRCPLCGETNACATEIERLTGVGQPPCWCMSAEFPQALLARVPEESRGLACICARCTAQAAMANPIAVAIASTGKTAAPD